MLVGVVLTVGGDGFALTSWTWTIIDHGSLSTEGRVESGGPAGLDDDRLEIFEDRRGQPLRGNHTKFVSPIKPAQRNRTGTERKSVRNGRLSPTEA